MKKSILNCVLVTCILMSACQCTTMTRGTQDTPVVQSDPRGATVTLPDERTLKIPEDETKALQGRLRELKQLLDNGTINQKEYERLRSKTIDPY